MISHSTFRGQGSVSISPLPHYLLTFTASSLEVGIPAYFLLHHPIWLIGIAMCFYHLGYLVDYSIRLPVKAYTKWLLIPSFFLVMYAMSSPQCWVIFPSVILLNTTIQSIRSIYKNAVRIDPRKKGFSRLAGFVVGPIMPISPIALLIIGLITTLFVFHNFPRSLNSVQSDVTEGGQITVQIVSWTLAFEMLHHLHYFTYCYFLIATLYALQAPFTSLGLLFVVGWIGYAIDELTISSFRPIHIAIGHLLSAASILLFLSNSIALVLLGWFLTGVGGGTAYGLNFLGYLNERKRDREKYENLGHVFGAFTGSIMMLMGELQSVFLSASIISIASAFVMIASKYIKRT